MTNRTAAETRKSILRYLALNEKLVRSDGTAVGAVVAEAIAALAAGIELELDVDADELPAYESSQSGVN
jgi:hypothetical protein